MVRSAGGWSEVFQLRKENNPWVHDSRVLGNGDFVEESLKENDRAHAERVKLINEGWDLPKLVGHVCKHLGIDPQDIHRKGRKNPVSRGRDLIAYLGRKKMGLPAREIQELLLISQPALSKAIVRGENDFSGNPVKL